MTTWDGMPMMPGFMNDNTGWDSFCQNCGMTTWDGFPLMPENGMTTWYGLSWIPRWVSFYEWDVSSYRGFIWTKGLWFAKGKPSHKWFKGFVTVCLTTKL
eukprot:1679874-Amphidinium_carterae.1